MKKLSKILAIILLVAIAMTIGMGTVVNASAEKVDDLFTGGNADVGGINTVGKNIVSIITTVGIIVAVIVLLILGIKYMMGSASEKAEYKKTMIPYVVGALLVFAGTSIVKVVYSLATSAKNGLN